MLRRCFVLSSKQKKRWSSVHCDHLYPPIQIPAHNWPPVSITRTVFWPLTILSIASCCQPLNCSRWKIPRKISSGLFPVISWSCTSVITSMVISCREPYVRSSKTNWLLANIRETYVSASDMYSDVHVEDKRLFWEMLKVEFRSTAISSCIHCIILMSLGSWKWFRAILVNFTFWRFASLKASIL